MVNSYVSPLLFILLLNFPLSLFAEGELSWRQVRDEEGIQLFIAKVGDTSINKVKAVTVINVGLERLVSALNEVKNYPSWVPYLDETRILERYSEDELLVYNFFDAPWPVRDRDYVYRVRIERKPGDVIYHMSNEESELMPAQKNAVRAVLIESRYRLTALDDKQTRMELLFHTDPRGQLPLWIINIVHKRVPFDGLMKLRNRLETQD